VYAHAHILCVYAHAHILHVWYSDVSPGVGTRHLESPEEIQMYCSDSTRHLESPEEIQMYRSKRQWTAVQSTYVSIYGPKIKDKSLETPRLECCFVLLTRGWGRLETRPQVALGSSPELVAFTMSLAPLVQWLHHWWTPPMLNCVFSRFVSRSNAPSLLVSQARSLVASQ